MELELKSFKQEYHFVLPDKVQWGDMDAFGHVNNTVYFRYFERVRFALFEKYSLLSDINSTGIGPVLASTQCRFKTALEYPDNIYIGTRISELKEDRFLMTYGIFSERFNCIASQGEGFIIYYNFRDKLKSSMPDEHFQRLKSQIAHE